MPASTRVLLDGLVFPEGPRWHAGKLWFSDMHAHCVMTVDLAGRAETVVEVPGQPSGLGWLPDGRLLVVSMTDRRLLRLDPGGLTVAADLAALASFHCNDMVVDARGRAYVGNFGFDLHAAAPFHAAELVLVPPGAAPRVVAADLAFPNGCVITPDGGTLIVGESGAARLTAFTIAADGSLGERRVWLRGHQRSEPILLAFQYTPSKLRLSVRRDRSGLPAPLLQRVHPRPTDVIPPRELL